jgi:parvulin-like peptidyl-prolyl isomerase
MFSYRTLSFVLAIIVLGGSLCWRLATHPRADGDEAPTEQPVDINKLIEDIPLAELNGDTLLQSDAMIVTLKTVEVAETGVLDSRLKEDPNFVADAAFKTYMRRHVAVQFLVNQLVEKYIQDNKIAVPQDRVVDEFKKFKVEVEEQGGKYDEYVKASGMSDEEFQKVWGNNWALSEHSQLEVKDKEVDAKFAELKDQMNTIPLRRVSHILFMYKGSMRADEAKVTRSKEEAKAAAEAAHKQVVAGGDFAALAKEKSDCTSKPQGGDLRFFPETGAMDEAFSKAAYALKKVGDVTEVVETPFGFHVIKLTELRTNEDLKKLIRANIAKELVSLKIRKILTSGLVRAKFNAKFFAAPPKPEVKENNDGANSKTGAGARTSATGAYSDRPRTGRAVAPTTGASATGAPTDKEPAHEHKH